MADIVERLEHVGSLCLSQEIARTAYDGAAEITRLRRLLNAAGWQLVPQEPTDWMLSQGIGVDWRRGHDTLRRIWKAMLAGAPTKQGHSPGWAFAEGDLVRKKSGSWWEGRVVGTYSTQQTLRGYAVQLDKPFGPVQIYPESALELVPQAKEGAPGGLQS